MVNDVVIFPNVDASKKKGLFGNVDRIDSTGVSGWAIDMSNPYESLDIRVYLGDILVASGLTKIKRPDISAILQQDVLCGFDLDWTKSLTDALAGFKRRTKEIIKVKLVIGNKKYCINSHYCPSEPEIISWEVTTENRRIKNKKDNFTLLTSPDNLSKQFTSLIGESPEPSLRASGDIKLIAYYLPQFHPIKENDEWWGAGFTEWINVAQAKPYFSGHYQPHVPGELGYYDLRLPEVREAQAKLARDYGIYGFCYYYYWFEGRRLLERPLEEVFNSGKPDFPFCICWANENWSRRWDGSEDEILVQQIHNEDTDEQFILDIIPLLKDARYILLNGSPLIIIYRVSLMPNPLATSKKWRNICKKNGIPNIHLCMAETFGLSEPRQFGFDSAVQFPPHGLRVASINNEVESLEEGFKGNLYKIDDVIKQQIGQEAPSYKRFPGVMTSWDNTARKKKSGNVFLGGTPENYEIWLRGAIDYARDRLPVGERLVFINAWNEWAEGAHLEPDRQNGRSYLEATKRALTGSSDWEVIMRYAEKVDTLSGNIKESVLSDLNYALVRYKKVNHYLLEILGDNGLPKQFVVFKKGLPNSIHGLPLINKGLGKIDQINHCHDPKFSVIIESSQKMFVYGWSFSQGYSISPDTPSYFVLKKLKSGEKFYAPIIKRLERTDVLQKFISFDETQTKFSGFKEILDVSAVAMGVYSVSMLTRYSKHVIETEFDLQLEIA